MGDNQENGMADEIGMETKPTVKRGIQPKRKPGGRPAIKKVEASKPDDALDVPKKEKFIDPEDDRENWPTIFIDLEDQKPNFAYLCASGTKKNNETFHHALKVMRGVEVKVPPSIVYALRDAISTHYVKRKDPTGREFLARQNRSAVPWQLISGGKYVK